MSRYEAIFQYLYNYAPADGQKQIHDTASILPNERTQTVKFYMTNRPVNKDKSKERKKTHLGDSPLPVVKCRRPNNRNTLLRDTDAMNRIEL